MLYSGAGAERSGKRSPTHKTFFKNGFRRTSTKPPLWTLNFNLLFLLGTSEPLAVKERLGETRDEEKRKKEETPPEEEAGK